MRVIGLIWTLYPLLGLFAFLEFALGLLHVFFCLPYAHFYLTFWSGISAAITSVYALLLDYPNKCELLLQFVSAFFAFFLSLTSVTEAICIRRVHLPSGHLSFCAGLLNRTATKQLQCERVLGHFQTYLLERFSTEPVSQSQQSVRLFVSTMVAICAVSQFFSGIVLFTYSARSNRFHLTSAHWHCILGLAVLLVAVVHAEYCSPLFFVHVVPLVGLYSVLFALLPLPPSRSPFRQFLAIVGAAGGTVLGAICCFSMFCWANQATPRAPGLPPFLVRNEDQLAQLRRSGGREMGVARFCQYPERVYAHCERQLEFSFPYLDWPPEQASRNPNNPVPSSRQKAPRNPMVENEKAIVRVVAHSLLGLCAAGLVSLFMGDAFCS